MHIEMLPLLITVFMSIHFLRDNGLDLLGLIAIAIFFCLMQWFPEVTMIMTIIVAVWLG